MKRRGLGRVALAFTASLIAYQLLVLPYVGGARTGWGLLLIYLTAAVGLTLLFTLVYDGPRALIGLIRPRKGSVFGAGRQTLP